EDNPAFLNYRSERGRVLYGEDVYIIYRYFETIKRNPVGHLSGGCPTSFGMSQLHSVAG
ncbi:hypothetical protein BGZ61DRAFT_373620, partial [Ilyonectria robusta]|uniref:uncharacterized protein n=1 Tax=Ilyonectria robusta TaxID=1079257 RepID=UPI001E8EBCEB